MPRPTRLFLPGHLYHLTQRGSRKHTVFGDEEDFEVYLPLLRRNLESRGVLLHQYCCMTNHVHLLVQPSNETGISAAMSAAHGQFARYLNRKNDWVGHVWHGRFRDSLVWPSATKKVIKYIARNPVEGGLVMKAVDWPYSSARDLAGMALDPFITCRRLRLAADVDWRVELDIPMGEDELEALKERLHAGLEVGERPKRLAA
ncbi:MAG: transposase [Planctomycetota bacterium]|jgi:putative transposase